MPPLTYFYLSGVTPVMVYLKLAGVPVMLVDEAVSYLIVTGVLKGVVSPKPQLETQTIFIVLSQEILDDVVSVSELDLTVCFG